MTFFVFSSIFSPQTDTTTKTAQKKGLTKNALVWYSNLMDAAEQTIGFTAAFGISAGAAGQHAGEFETSVIAALAPQHVRVDRLAEGHVGEPGDAQSLFFPSLRDRVESGVVGDPRSANASRADAYLDAWVDELERVYVRGVEPMPGRV